MINIKPKDRSERVSKLLYNKKHFIYLLKQIANKNRETIEKAFISDRIGAYNKKSEPLKLNEPNPNSNLFINEAERFNKDFASNEYERRQYLNEKRRKRNETIREIIFEKEQRRWERMDYEYMKELNKAMLNKEKNIVGKKNNPGLAFNPITLEYDKSIQGEILRNRDDQAKYRAQLRTNNLEFRNNCNYNLFTGEQRVVNNNLVKPKFFSQI